MDDFQPYYVFNPKKHIRDLQIGAEILKEVMARESEKEERTMRRDLPALLRWNKDVASG